MSLLCYIDNDWSEWGHTLPNAVLMQTEEIPEGEKPHFVLIQLSSPARWECAWHCAKHKIPFALIPPKTDEELDKLKATARRNKVAFCILGSWRYIPAVAALRELVDTQCLGKIQHIKGFSRIPSPRLTSIMRWLAPGIPAETMPELPEYQAALQLSGTNGYAIAQFDLDGQRASFEQELLGWRHNRVLPQADPAVSELAILAFLLERPENANKVKYLDLLEQ